MLNADDRRRDHQRDDERERSSQTSANSQICYPHFVYHSFSAAGTLPKVARQAGEYIPRTQKIRHTLRNAYDEFQLIGLARSEASDGLSAIRLKY
jgi:hypothetical protein